MTRLVAPKAVGRCPACGEALAVRRLQCPCCEVSVEGRFPPSPYAALLPEQLSFLEIFLRARGNLREVERVLGLSYPTVRSRFDAVLDTLGFAASEGLPVEAQPEDPPAPPSRERRATLEALQRGEITAAEAVARLKGVPARGPDPASADPHA